MEPRLNSPSRASFARTGSRLVEAKLVRDRRGGGLLLVCWAIIWVTLSSGASPARDPKRIVHNFTVDLAPLLKWWQKHDGQRPLTAWIRLTGPIVATNSGAWVVEGKLDDLAGHGNSRAGDAGSSSGSETVRILLIHPPVEDAAEFQRLVARLAQLNQTQAALGAEKAQAHDRDQAVTKMQQASRRERAHARVLAAESKQIKT